jgi:hypothetical protein
VRNRGTAQEDACHLGTGHFSALPDRIGHFAGLSETNAHTSRPIAHHHQGAKVETATALDDLGGPVDKDNFLDQILPPTRGLVILLGTVATRATTTTMSAGFRDRARFRTGFYFGFFSHNDSSR